MTLVLPWPARDLNPNSRAHWSTRSKAAKAARKTAGILARDAGWTRCPWEGRVHLWVDFYPPDKRRRDDDNVFAAFKAYRDGIADALGIDDSRFFSHHRLHDDAVMKGGRVLVRITDARTWGLA